LLTIDELQSFIASERHLPSIIGRDEWKEKGGISLGQLVSQIWEAVEINSIYLTEINSRLNDLDGGAVAANLQGSFNGGEQVSAGHIEVKTALFEGRIEVRGQIYASGDTAGQAQILTGATKVKIDFDMEVTLASLGIGTHWVFDNGFMFGIDWTILSQPLYKYNFGF